MSLFVCLLVCMFFPYLLRNIEPQRAEILSDDFPWDKEDFQLKNIRLRRTDSRKIEKTRACPVPELLRDKHTDRQTKTPITL